MAKLWHDDVRPAPDGWLLARTNTQAKQILMIENVEECSLDHDLGCVPEEGLYAQGQGEETGMDLVRWMIEHNCVPAKVTIHSWNQPRAMAMAHALDDAGYPVTVRPYVIPAAA